MENSLKPASIPIILYFLVLFNALEQDWFSGFKLLKIPKNCWVTAALLHSLKREIKIK